MAYEERLLPLLQLIESGINVIYQASSEMHDFQALAAVEAAQDYFIAQQRHRQLRDFNLDELSKDVYVMITTSITEFLEMAEKKKAKGDSDTPNYSVNDFIDALKTIKASIGKWTKMKGRQGYLNFITEFLP